jgi:transketolase
MFVAEQNMAGAALGMALRGKIPFISTFAAFFARAYDQIRMSQYSSTNIKFCGSHAGVSIGPDGSSQMGLEDISMFRSLLDCTVFYPSDAVSTEAAVREAAAHKGNVYIRTTRMDTPVIYESMDGFNKGASRVVKRSSKDRIAIISGGVTLHESLKAYEELKDE